MSKLFSFTCNSSSLRFGLTPWQFQNIMFVPMKTKSDTCHERWPTGEVLFGIDGLVSKRGGGGG